MKRFLVIALVLMISIYLVACNTRSETPSIGDTSPIDPGPVDDSDAPDEPAGDSKLALITGPGDVTDKGFNQYSWEGLEQYALEHSISHEYYQPTDQSTEACLAAIELAVKEGATLIVTPGNLFEGPVFIAQETYPDVHFVLIDGQPHNASDIYRTNANTVSIFYAEEQAGFLAGYAAVKDGFTKLGFLGGMAADPAVVRFGYGYVQGAEFAAKELGIADGAITMNYHYTDSLADAPEDVQAMATSWYESGLEVIFDCDGANGNSVIRAAEEADGKVIGVDVDRSGESTAIITSAMKGLSASVYTVISDYYAGNFPGGEVQIFAASRSGVGLPMETSRFENFTQADYDAIYALLAGGEVIPDKDIYALVTDIPTGCVEINLI